MRNGWWSYDVDERQEEREKVHYGVIACWNSEITGARARSAQRCLSLDVLHLCNISLIIQGHTELLWYAHSPFKRNEQLMWWQHAPQTRISQRPFKTEIDFPRDFSEIDSARAVASERTHSAF